MAIEVVPGPLKFIDSESLTVSSSAVSFTAAAYSKSTAGKQEDANVAFISTLDEPIYISFVNSDHSTPDNADEGIYWTAAMGPYVCHHPLADVRLLRVSADADVNVNYFVLGQ